MTELRARNLKKSYGKRTILRDVDVTVGQGEVIGLLGPNGAGKTTCFYMIVGLVSADGGSIKLDDTDITKMPMHARAKLGVGYLPQEASVFRKLSVKDNLMAVLETRKELTQDQRLELMESILDDLQIQHIRDSQGIALSGGERRRVEIARALAMQPTFILLDEPFAGVDPISVLDIQRIIEHLKERDIGVLITDHNVRETLGICDRAYIMSGGYIIAEGNAETVLNNQKVRDVYLGSDFKL